MKNVLLIGAGSKWGSIFTDLLISKDCKIDLITSTGIEHNNINNIMVDWNSFDFDDIEKIVERLELPFYDLIFFNQNSGGGPNDSCFEQGNDINFSSWSKSFLIDTQFPYYLIKKINEKKIKSDTKVGWMLTGLINSADADHWKYAGYASVKTSNLHIMRAFSQYSTGIYFCIQPIWFPEDSKVEDAGIIFKSINNLNINDTGKIILKNGDEWEYFKRMH